jgi:hypothetical protein
MNPIILESNLLSQEEIDTASLHRAQTTAIATIKPEWFHCYTPEHIQSRRGLKSKILWFYSKCYNGAAFIGNTFHKTVAAVKFVAHPLFVAGNFLFGGIANRINNLVFPINPINGRREFRGISRRCEKFIGDWIIYPLALFDEKKRYPRRDSVAGTVNKVFLRLKKANKELLNPSNERVKFKYRVNTLQSPEINAFAAPGGGIALFSGLAENLEYLVQNKKIKETKVKFADGSVAKVDLSGVTFEDVIAAVLGHEMTHVASRHGIIPIINSVFWGTVRAISSFIFIEILSKIFALFEEKILNIPYLFKSRRQEYEADVTGTYFSKHAGFNPLGALYLHEAFLRMGLGNRFFDKQLEFTHDHPYIENRKRAIFASIQEFDPHALKGRVKWRLAHKGYDFARSSTAITYAHNTAAEMRSA